MLWASSSAEYEEQIQDLKKKIHHMQQQMEDDLMKRPQVWDAEEQIRDLKKTIHHMQQQQMEDNSINKPLVWDAAVQVGQNDSNTSRAVSLAKEAEKTVRQMISAVNCPIAKSSDKSSPFVANCLNRASKSSMARSMDEKALARRMWENAGSIIARWRRQIGPLDTNMLLPTSGAKAPTIRSFLGKISLGSERMDLVKDGSLTMMIDRLE